MGGVVIDVAKVRSLSTDLGKTNTLLAKEFTAIEQSMQSLGSAWQDHVGQQYMAQFNSFINQSKVINEKVKNIKAQIDNKANYYSGALNRALARMRG